MSNSGFLHAMELDGKGGGRSLDAVTALKTGVSEKIAWIHLNHEDPATDEWVRNESGLNPIVCDALLEEETRPRCVAFAEGLLVILRGVNLNQGAEPEDMASLRIWLEERRIVSLRSERLQTAVDVQNSLLAGNGPKNLGDFLVQFIEKLNDQMDPLLDELDTEIERLYEDDRKDHRARRADLSDLRRRIIILRRHIAPQRDLLGALQMENISWLTKSHRLHLREAGDRLHRFVEELDAAGQHAAIAQDDIRSAQSDDLNRKMYFLSIMTCIFLPLGFLTGLLGINVAGIPGSEHPHAFLAFCSLLVVIFAVQIMIFKKIKIL